MYPIMPTTQIIESSFGPRTYLYHHVSAAILGLEDLQGWVCAWACLGGGVTGLWRLPLSLSPCHYLSQLGWAKSEHRHTQTYLVWGDVLPSSVTQTRSRGVGPWGKAWRFPFVFIHQGFCWKLLFWDFIWARLDYFCHSVAPGWPVWIFDVRHCCSCGCRHMFWQLGVWMWRDWVNKKSDS